MRAFLISPVETQRNQFEAVVSPHRNLSLAKVLDHLRLYEHPLLKFSARETNGLIEILIDLKNCSVPVHTYVLPIHARDLDHPQFAWHLQRQIYDGLHDYFVEMFTKTPQDRTPKPVSPGGRVSDGHTE